LIFEAPSEYLRDPTPSRRCYKIYERRDLIYAENELEREATCAKFAPVQNEVELQPDSFSSILEHTFNYFTKTPIFAIIQYK
jgi:hypothetical protein